MKTCTDCGGDAGRGWTNPSDHDHCASCDMARALGTPIPPRPNPELLNYQQRYYRRRKLQLRGTYHGRT